MDERVWQALLLTMMGAAGTAFGGLIVVAQPKMDFKKLGVLQGLAAGLMISISVFDMMPEAVKEIGAPEACMWFYAGVLFFAAVVFFIPEPNSGFLTVEGQPARQAIAPAKGKSASEAAAPTSASLSPDDKAQQPAAGPVPLGTPLRRSARRANVEASMPSPAPSRSTSTNLAEVDGSPEPQPLASAIGPSPTAVEAAAAAAVALESWAAKKRLLMSGVITAVGISLHNFPEGVAVFLAAMKSKQLGASLAVAIALHNVPEGVAVALPVYFATGSRWKGFMYAAVSGLAEPAAVIFLAIAMPSDLDKMWVNRLLAAVGGIMAFLSISELMPLSLEHAGRQMAVAAFFAGMAIMSGTILALHHYVPDMDH